MIQRRVAVAGFGAIGRAVAAALDRGIPGLTLTAVSARDLDRVRDAVADFVQIPPLAVPLEELAGHADIIVEAAPAALLPRIAEPVLRAGKTAVVLSAGALLEHDYLIGLAAAHGGQIVVPTGALIGLDAVTAPSGAPLPSARTSAVRTWAWPSRGRRSRTPPGANWGGQIREE